MNKGWPVKPVAQIAQCSLGKMLDKAKNKGTPRPYLRNVNVRWFSFDLNDLLEMRFLEQEAPKFTAVKGDVLICEGGYPGRAAIWSEEYPIHFQKAIHRVRFHDPERNKWFLYYLYYQETTGQLRRYYTGTGIQHFTGEALSRLQIPLPPLPEQRRIVGILDEAFEGIATAKRNAEKNIQNARALFETRLNEVFTARNPGWVERRLEEIGTTQTGSTPKTADRSNYGNFVPFVKPADFNTDGSLDYENAGLTEKGFSEARKVAAGSVLMVCIGATIGKCGYCERDITMNQQINALTPTSGSYHRFLYYQMLTEGFQRRVIHGSGQATLPIINKSKWSALPVSLPPTITEQRRIAGKLDDLRKETQRLANLYERKLMLLDGLKKSFLNKAFSGEF